MSSQMNSSSSIKDFKNMPQSKVLNGKQVVWLEWLDTVMLIWKLFIICISVNNEYTQYTYGQCYFHQLLAETLMSFWACNHTHVWKWQWVSLFSQYYSQMTQGMLMMFKCCNHVQHRWKMARSHFRHQGGNGEWCSDFRLCSWILLYVNMCCTLIKDGAKLKAIWVMVQWYHRYQDILEEKYVYHAVSCGFWMISIDCIHT